VPRCSRYASCWLGCVLWLSGVGGAAEQVSRPSETLLPDTTQGFFAISNVDTLSEHWNKTQLGHLMADPVMEPFRKDLQRQIEERWSSVHDRLGITLADMKGVPGGDVGIGLIAPAPGKAALAIVIDVTGKLPQAHEMLQQITKRQLERGAKRSETKVEGCPDIVIQFDLPELEEEKEAGRSTLRGSEKSEAAKAAEGKAAAGDKKAAAGAPAPQAATPRQAFYCLTGNLLAVADDLKVMKGILGRAMGHQNGSLADHKPFQTVMQRCRADYGKRTSQTRWFIHPLGYAEAARAATPEYRRRKGKSILEVMRNQGIAAVQGIGGFLDFNSEGYEMVHRTNIYAPPPYEKAMKMAVLLNKSDFVPQSWVPRDIATYTTFYFDIQNAFEHFGSLFDELFGQGETGVWEEIKQTLKEDPNGPQIDLRTDLIKHLGRRVSMLTDYELPITTTSERLLFAIEAANPKAVASAIEKLMKNDSTAKARDEKGHELKKDDPTIHQRAVDGHLIWEVSEDDSPTPQAPEISFGDTPAVAPVHPLKKRKKQKEGEDEEEEKEQRLLPHAAMTVWKGHLLIASHIDFLLKVVAPAEKPEPLSEDVDYLLVDEQIKSLEPKAKCVRVFSRTDEEYRPTYELIRQNKMPESETMLARLLNVLFGEGKKGVRAQRIDGRQLPEYQVVRRYLGPAGLQATSEPNGWFLKGFTLSKEVE
jgi:hypothetical protein